MQWYRIITKNIFCQSSQECILCVQRNNLMKLSFLITNSILNTLRTFGAILLVFYQKIFARVVENVFHVSRETFWEKNCKQLFCFPNISDKTGQKSFSVLAVELKLFGIQSRKLCWFVISAIYKSQTNFWVKTVSKKKNIVLIFTGHRRKNLQPSVWSSVGGVVKNKFLACRLKVWGLLSKEIVKISIPDIDASHFRFLPEHFRWNCENVHYV